MDLHIYRDSQDRWYDLSAAARGRGAVLAVNAFTLDELASRLTPEMRDATSAQRLAAIEVSTDATIDKIPRSRTYICDALSELKAARVRPNELRAAGGDFLAGIMEQYDRRLQKFEVADRHDRFAVAASRVREVRIPWLNRFNKVVLHALYDLSEAQFALVRTLIEMLPGGGDVMVFNTTTNVKPTQFAEWTWQRFLQDDALAEKTFPDFFRSSRPSRAVLEKLFVYDAHDPFPPDPGLRIIEAGGRYEEAQVIGGEVRDLLAAGENPSEIVIVVRHIDLYGEMIEDVLTRYGVPHRFASGVPLVRVPVIKYWLSLLDLVTSERSRIALSRVMSSAYFTPRMSPAIDIERILAECGYIDRHHMRASVIAARRNSPVAPELERFEQYLDSFEVCEATPGEFIHRFQPPAFVNERDRQAWRILADELASADEMAGPVSFTEFRRLASELAGIRTADMNTAAHQPGFQNVRIVHPESLGYREYKWIFAPGFTDGEIPARAHSNPLLPESLVIAVNERIRPRRLLSVRDRGRREPLYLFTLLDSACRLTLTYPASSLEGDSLYRSVYVNEIARHYERNPVSRASAAPPRSENEWRSHIAEEWRRGRLNEERASALLGQHTVDRAKVEAMGIQRFRTGRDFMSTDVLWSPTELNALSSCPTVFLARYRLKVRPAVAPEFEIPSLEIGILAHAVLRDFHAAPVPEDVQEARRRMDQIIRSRLSAADVNGTGTYSVFDPSLWQIRRAQLVAVLQRYAEFAVRDALDGFQTLPEYLDAALPPQAVGSTIVGGKPDHVGIRRRGERIDAIRVDDFKYSAASGSTSRQLKQSLQIPVYAYLAARALAAPAECQIEGRYVLLRSPGTPVVSQAIDDTVFAELRERTDALMTLVRNGEFAPHPADPQACTGCPYRRLCRLYGS